MDLAVTSGRVEWPPMRLDYETRESAQRKKETSIGRGVPVDGISEVLVGHGLGTN